MYAHPLRAGGDFPRDCCLRIPSCDRRSAGPASTVCREVNRNGWRRNYRAQKAEERASKRARRRPKRCLLAIDDRLPELVAAKLEAADCSPQQISGWLKREHPSDEAMRVSHESI